MNSGRPRPLAQGFDYLWVDAEHSTVTPAAAERMFVAAERRGSTALPIQQPRHCCIELTVPDEMRPRRVLHIFLLSYKSRFHSFWVSAALPRAQLIRGLGRALRLCWAPRT